MFNKVDLVVFYFTYTALMMALTLCSILSPIHVRSVGERNLSVYGVALIYDSPPSAAPVASESASKSLSNITETSNGSVPLVKTVRIRSSLAYLPASTLTRCMTAYLVFASMCLLLCLLLLVFLLVQMLPRKHDCSVIMVTRILTVLVPVASIACFAMTAVLGLQSHLYDSVAGGYYMGTALDRPVSQLRSGFSSAAVAALIGLLVGLVSPVLQMW
ncbi:hypothetical protein, unknown function [Leishmania tarentolae]|uniref:Uncharacterized protein n=1 Tax=Leishmania tarentolae TaxID=5689 RepID=A0A640KZ14_LEITA|nr:hypothetical protein, unknown function [Leishmania tarentolae]